MQRFVGPSSLPSCIEVTLTYACSLYSRFCQVVIFGAVCSAKARNAARNTVAPRGFFTAHCKAKGSRGYSFSRKAEAFSAFPNSFQKGSLSAYMARDCPTQAKGFALSEGLKLPRKFPDPLMSSDSVLRDM